MLNLFFMTQSLHSHLFPVGHAILLYVSLPVMSWLGVSPLCRCSLCFWSSLCSRVVFFLFAFCASKVLFVVTLVRSHLSSLTHGLGTTVSECLRESSLRLCPEDFLRCSLLLNPDVSPLGFSVSQFCLIANRATSVLPDPSRRAGPHPGLSRGAP